jgi:hypothetical protein
MEGLTSDDRSEPNSPFILIPIFFIIKRVLKKLTSINPPIAPSRDAGNGSNKAEMNPIAMYKLIHFIVYNNKCLLLLLENPLITHHPVSFTYIMSIIIVRKSTHYASPCILYLYYTTNTIKANVYTAIQVFPNF